MKKPTARPSNLAARQPAKGEARQPAKVEARQPCPVCLGVNLAKKRIGDEGLVLDHCERCGGVWFELGEVQALRRAKPHALWARVAQRAEPPRMACHDCHAPMGRHDAACTACGWNNQLDCPACLRPMEHAHHAQIRLDACRNCKGVWFDHDELAEIWNDSFGATLERRRRTAGESAGEGAFFLVEALAWDPFLGLYAAHAAGHVIGASAEVLSHAPEAAGAAFEAAGEVAGGVFETIVEIIGGLFG
jgi:Zn-finger nucleic acid-binding protein